MVVFGAKLVKETIKFDKEEILDVKWFDYDEIINRMDNELRGNYVKTVVTNHKKKLIAPNDIVHILNE